MVILVVFKGFLLVKNLEILIQIVPVALFITTDTPPPQRKYLCQVKLILNLLVRSKGEGSK